MPSDQLPVPFGDIQWRLPDKGVMRYVKDMLDSLGVDVEHIEEHQPYWLPAGIMGTLDWVTICGWWIWRNTGFFDTDEAYKFIIEFNGYEFDPDMLLVFREKAERNKFKERINNPGIEGRERAEALQFLREDVYSQWAKEMGVDPGEFVPPQQLVELVMWATMMWVLSEYGRDWIYTQDEVMACIMEFGVAYMEKWSGENGLLDPVEVKVTDRPISSCRYCGQVLWCVRGAFLQGDKWQFMCINCLVTMWENGEAVDERDDRVVHPKCPHKQGISGSTNSCSATCPHSQVSQESIMQKMEEHGSQRLQMYRDRVAVSGVSHRRSIGQSLDDLVQHFREGDGER